jgi:hypothetical protein
MTDTESLPTTPRRIVAANLTAEIAALRKEFREAVARLDGDIAGQLARIEHLEAAAATYEGITAELAEVHTLVKAVAIWQDAQDIAEAERKKRVEQAEERQVAREQRRDAKLKSYGPLLLGIVALLGNTQVQKFNGPASTVLSVLVVVACVALYVVFQWRDTPSSPPSSIIPPEQKGP